LFFIIKEEFLMSVGNSLNASQKYPLALSEDIIVQDYGNETLIYNLKNNKMFHLNETSSLVWQFCDGRNSIEQISREVSQKLATYASEEVVWLALQYLQTNSLLVQNKELEANLTQISRREMIKKAGLATMVAFPLITSVVAPSAALAASGAENAGCTNDCTDSSSMCGCVNAGCSNGTLVNIDVSVGLCVDVATAINTYGVSVAAGVEGNVCVGLNVCV
jgi:Coenzyme PQQ synthesis protein D (PqqD)